MFVFGLFGSTNRLPSSRDHEYDAINCHRLDIRLFSVISSALYCCVPGWFVWKLTFWPTNCCSTSYNVICPSSAVLIMLSGPGSVTV